MSSRRLSWKRSRFRVPALVLTLLVFLAALPVIGAGSTLRLPTGVSRAQAYRMYAEQLDCQSSIKQLVDGNVTSIYVTNRVVSPTRATLNLRVRGRDGLQRTGVMRLFRANNIWYFESISRSNVPKPNTSVSNPDVGVINTILAQHASNGDIGSRLVHGTYTTIEVGSPRKGYRSTELPVRLIGSRATSRGRLTAIRSVRDGQPVWFLTGFSAQ